MGHLSEISGGLQISEDSAFDPVVLVPSSITTGLTAILDLDGEATLEPEASKVTSNQCYKHFTSLYLQVCETGLFLKSIITPCVVKLNVLMVVFTFKNQVL